MTRVFITLFFTLSTIVQAQTYSGAHPKNIILMIGDGMGTAQVYAAYTANHGSLNMLLFPYTGFSITWSADDYITDSAAGASALASGKKTKNGQLNIDTLGHSNKTIVEYAKDKELSTGIISTSSITHATPAGFVAHYPDRNNDEDIALFFMRTTPDVIIGGGEKYFKKRKDGKNLLDSLKQKGYNVLDSVSNRQKINGNKLACFTAAGHNPKHSAGRGDMLPNAVSTAIDILKNNPKGFFMMAEGSMIDWGCHNNNDDYMIEETIDFDKAVERALNFAKNDGNTLVIVTADHETGGVSLKGGNFKKGSVKVNFSSFSHTGVMVPVFAYGPGAQLFTGVQDNTDIFKKMMLLLNLNQ